MNMVPDVPKLAPANVIVVPPDVKSVVGFMDVMVGAAKLSVTVCCVLRVPTRTMMPWAVPCPTGMVHII
jgi:hypothetical protein